MGRARQQTILEIISGMRIGNQHQLVAEMERRGIATTQSSISRDIAKLGLVKANGFYSAPGPEVLSAGQIVSIDTAGDCLIVIRTEIGQASPTALKIDRAGIGEIVGTVAGDDTILIAVKNVASQRVGIKKIMEIFAGATPGSSRVRSKSAAADEPVFGS